MNAPTRPNALRRLNLAMPPPAGPHQSVFSGDDWPTMVRTHLLARGAWCPGLQTPEIIVPEGHAFRGHARPGCLGGLQFCHFVAAPHVFLDHGSTLPGAAGHLVVVQLSGASVISNGTSRVRLRPGEFALINGMASTRVENQTWVEHLLLNEPIPPAQMAELGPPGLHHCVARQGAGRLAVEWLRDACLTPPWCESPFTKGLARALGSLLFDALVRPEPATRQPALHRQAIEAYVQGHHADPELDVAHIAHAFGCSARSLHRAFSAVDGESLERCIRRTRTEALAAALRDPAFHAEPVVLLARRCGFASAAHATTLFRELHGTTPAEYRRLSIAVPER